MMIQATNTTSSTLVLDQGNWEKLASEAKGHGNVHIISWNPLLRTEDERIEFEELAQTQEFTVGTNPFCFVCGSEDRGYINPESLVDLTGFGLFSCHYVEIAGRQGSIPEEICDLTAVVASTVCECGEIPPGTEVVDNLVDIPDRNLPF